MAQKQTQLNRPRARSERLVVESVGDETVIYDLDSHVAHALKPLAAAVYNHADGHNTVAEIAELSSSRLGQQISGSAVDEAVGQLNALNLLDMPEIDIAGGLSRRDALKVFAATGAGAALISSVAAPAAFAGIANNGAAYTCGTGCNPMTGKVGHQTMTYYQAMSGTGRGSMVNAGWTEFIGLPCNISSGTGSCGSTTPNAIQGEAYCSSTNDGVYYPSATTCAPGYTYSSSSRKCTAQGKSSYAPVANNCIPGNASCWSYNDGWGNGTYQCVPCDGNLKGCHWQCCEVVCVPNGTSIPGAISGQGQNSPYTSIYGGNYPAKYCTTNPCMKSNCPVCS